VRTVDMKLEVAVIPVSDVDRAKRFYGGLGWRLDAEFTVGNEFRGVQFTPPGSPCSIHFGKGVASAVPGSAKLYLVVSDSEAARAELVARGADVSEVTHREGPGKPPLKGPHPERRSYSSFASFSDPDGNNWLIQEVTARLPGQTPPTRHSVRRPSSRPHFDEQKPRTASTRSGPASAMRTGPTGTRNTWFASKPGKNCQHKHIFRD
jgi:catechol 2,3-dioxygenase-like lactoylglutathione lyase family enzyme